MNRLLMTITIVYMTSVVTVSSNEHSYQRRDAVPLVANKIGPFGNPSETYPYYSLGFCKPRDIEHQDHELGEYLSGDRKVNTPYDIRFRVNEEWRELCTLQLDEDRLEKFIQAVEEEYFFEMFLDDLPIWGYIGDEEVSDMILGSSETNRHFLYTHLHFDIGFNEDRIVDVNVTTDPATYTVINTHKAPQKVQFSYSVRWVPSERTFAKRMERYHDGQYLPATLEIHWFSIINSLILVVLLTAFLGVILMRIVRNDFTRYMRADTDTDLAEPETGWKLIHGDVFRNPAFVNILCAFVGTGIQIFLVTATLILMALAGAFVHARRGAMLTSGIVLYCLTGFVGGYLSARLFKSLAGTNWSWNIILTSAVFPVPLTAVFAVVNTMAIIQQSTAALPFGTIMIVLTMWLLVAFPLTVLGGIAGRHATIFKAPKRTNKVARQIPEVPFWRQGPAQMILAGFLPFSAISIELHYIFASVWGYRVYTLFGVLSIAFFLLIAVTAFITVATTYFQLAVEDHEWWWRAFLAGGMGGAFIYAYCFFYQINHSEMRGILQLSYFYGYSLVASYAAFLMLGAIGFIASFAFVRYIYSQVKSD